MGKIFINHAGTLREMSSIFVNDGGTLREAKAVYINHAGTLRKIFVQLFLSWTTQVVSLRSSGTPTAPSTATIVFNLAGDVSAGIVNQITDTLSGEEWLSTFPSPNSGADTWTVKIDAVGTPAPDFTTLNEGQEYTMDVARSFTLENNTPNSEGDFSINITFDDKAGTIVTKNVSLIMPVGTQP
jgi:hypothetical protein